MRSLPNLIEKYPDESLEGFLSRLALVNYRDVNELGLGTLTSKSTEEEIEEYLNKISVLSEQIITDDFLNTHKWLLSGLTLPGWKSSLFTRFCSTCLEEKPYHRANWSLTHYSYCYKHLAYMIEYCSICQNKITVKDVVKGKCALCNNILKNIPISEVGGDRHYLNADGDFKQINSPFLQHSLNIREQIFLAKWLSYILVEKTDLFCISFNQAEKKRFASSGYYHDVVKQFQMMSLAFDLLSSWPSKLVIFLNMHYKGSYYRTKGFMSKLVNLISNKTIKSVLTKSLRGEGIKNILFEELQYDHNFLFIEDFIEIFSISEELIHTYICQHQIVIQSHPRLN